MAEITDDNDPFEEDIVFDQTDLLGKKSRTFRQRVNNPAVIAVVPTFMMFLRTIALCIVFTGLGLCASVSTGPMIHLEVIIGIPASQAFHVFTAHSIGMLLGGIMGANLFEIYNRQFLIFVSIMWIAISVIILPFTLLVSFWWTMITLCAIGAGLSFIFTGSNVLCLDLWGKQGGAYLQGLHFSFAVGALIAPIVIHPFLMAPSHLGSHNSSDTPLSRVPREVDYFNATNVTMMTDLPLTTDMTLTVVSNSTVSNLNGTAKEVNPKPSFTNANLMHEPSKWDKMKTELEKQDDKVEIKSTTPQSLKSVNTTTNVSISPNASTVKIITTTEENTTPMTTDVPLHMQTTSEIPVPSIVATEGAPQVLGSQENLLDGTNLAAVRPSHQEKPFTFSNLSESDNAKILDSLIKSYEKYGITEMHLAYIFIGIFLVLNSLLSAIFLCVNPREPRSKQIDGVYSAYLRNKMNTFTFIFAMYMFSAEALQGAVHHLLASTHMSNGLPLVSRSIDGQAVFWGLISAVRFVCILITGCFRTKSGRLLLGSTILLVAGTILLSIGSFGKHDFILAGIVVVALGLAPILPSCFLWMSQYMRVTHRMCALMIIISSFGNSMTHTTLTFISADSHFYAIIMLALSVSAVVFLLLSFFMVCRNGVPNQTNSQSLGYHLANQLDDEEGLEMSHPLRDYGDQSVQPNGDPGDAQALLID